MKINDLPEWFRNHPNSGFFLKKLLYSTIEEDYVKRDLEIREKNADRYIMISNHKYDNGSKYFTVRSFYSMEELNKYITKVFLSCDFDNPINLLKNFAKETLIYDKVDECYLDFRISVGIEYA
jgi:hypothetical protein